VISTYDVDLVPATLYRIKPLFSTFDFSAKFLLQGIKGKRDDGFMVPITENDRVEVLVFLHV
jgi:hypothetical protein